MDIWDRRFFVFFGVGFLKPRVWVASSKCLFGLGPKLQGKAINLHLPLVQSASRRQKQPSATFVYINLGPSCRPADRLLALQALVEHATGQLVI